MALTTKDIAVLAGVSQSTVSRSLNNSPLISLKTRDRVLKIAQEQGFEFNANARGLSTNKTNTIGIIYPDEFLEFGISLYLGSLHSQLRETLEKKDMDLILAFKENRYTGADAIKRLIVRRKVDGIIIVCPQIHPKTLEFLRDAQVPFVFLHHHQDLGILEGINQVYTDHSRGGYMATEHLISLGHQRILCVSAKGGNEYTLRRKGYQAALKAHQIPYDEQLTLFGDCTFQSGYNLVMQYESLFRSVSSVFAHTDTMALGIMEALKQKHIRIPEDIALVGYDDVELCTYFHPQLTTIHQPREELAVLACELLFQLIESKRGKRAKDIKIQPTLVVRESCGANSLVADAH